MDDANEAVDEAKQEIEAALKDIEQIESCETLSDYADNIDAALHRVRLAQSFLTSARAIVKS